MEMVDCGEFGSGGKGEVFDASDVDLAATTTPIMSVSVSVQVTDQDLIYQSNH